MVYELAGIDYIGGTLRRIGEEGVLLQWVCSQ